MKRLLIVLGLVAAGVTGLGFEADTGVLIHRWEVWERIRAGDEPGSPKVGPAAPVA